MKVIKLDDRVKLLNSGGNANAPVSYTVGDIENPIRRS
mgnify:CR=1 FL=1